MVHGFIIIGTKHYTEGDYIFRSGPELPPFSYNGFVASLNFIEITTEAPTTVTTENVNKSGE